MTREVHIERVLKASPERVWQALSTPQELSIWLAPAEIDAGVGGQVSIFFENDENVRNGEILIWVEGRTLEYQWVFNGEAPSVVRFDLAPHPLGTHLTLRHRLLPAHLSSGYDSGWLAYLDRLEGFFAGDIPDFWERFEHWKARQETA